MRDDIFLGFIICEGWNSFSCSVLSGFKWSAFVINCPVHVHPCSLHLAHPHLLVRVASERFLPTMVTFRSVLASKRHWLQPVLVITVRQWSAPVSVGGLCVHGI